MPCPCSRCATRRCCLRPVYTVEQCQSVQRKRGYNTYELHITGSVREAARAMYIQQRENVSITEETVWRESALFFLAPPSPKINRMLYSALLCNL